MTARRARAMLDKLEKALPALPVPATQEAPVDWEAVSQRLLESGDAEGLDKASRRALADLRPYAEAVREFARGSERGQESTAESGIL